MNRLFCAIVTAFTWFALAVSPDALAGEEIALQNNQVSLRFDGASGALIRIDNKLTGETYQVSGDRFAVEAVEFRLEFADAKLTSLKQQGDRLRAQYQGGGMTIDVTYTLAPDRRFAERQMILTCNRPYGLKKVVLGRPAFSAADLRMISYRYPKFGRTPGQEPCCTFFGRTPKGGFFTGVEVPFDASSLVGQELTLAYAPSLKVAAGEKLVCEPVYFGVYRRACGDEEKKEVPLRRPRPAGPLSPGEIDEQVMHVPLVPENAPLSSESEAMVAMTSAILGPPRFGLVPMACAWSSEMEQKTYTEQSLAGDMKSLDFLASCGIDWVSDSHPWGGETEKMNALGADDKYEPGPMVRKFLDHAQKVGVKVVMWSSMNKTHPWSTEGRPFRADKPEWLLKPGASVTRSDARKWLMTTKGNCLANKPFFDWLVRINLEGLATGYFKGWAMDGDFFGGEGWYTSVIPVDCQSDKHDHLPGDSNYACQRALDQLKDSVRKHFPETYIFTCRPTQDLGVWSLRNVNVCWGPLEQYTDKDNLAAGDRVRKWSRVRVQRDFFPHYLDQPLLFPCRAEGARQPRNWPRGHIDYAMLSALSSSPNQIFYMPTKSGIPEADKAEIRKWLDWGRKNVEYLKVRKDLPDWPAAGKVDGSAHLLSDRGLIFLFNPDKGDLRGEFVLTGESIGLTRKGSFKVTQEYPPSDQTLVARSGEAVRWSIPRESAVVLRLELAQ